MNITSLFNRFRTSARKQHAASRHTRPRWRAQLGQTLRVEPLEQRAMLSVSTAYVDDAWVFVAAGDPSGLLGDTVNNASYGGDGSVAATYGVNAFGSVAYGPPTGSVSGYEEIADAIDATGSGGETRVLHYDFSASLDVTSPIRLSGDFTIPSGDLELDNADAILAPGAGSSGGAAGTMTLTSGNLALTAGTLFTKIDSSGTAAKIDVQDGAVTIATGVELSVASADYTASTPKYYTIIDNDSTDAVSGTFAGLNEGATITAGDYEFTISYVGGTGNDVVLTLTAVPAQEAFTTYVHDAWTVVSGTTVTDGTITTEFETQSSPVNGFTTSGWDSIASAVAAVADRGSVQVLHSPTGGYSEDVTIAKSMTLAGPFELDGDLEFSSASYATLLTSLSSGTVRVNALTLSDDSILSMTISPDGTSDLVEIEGNNDMTDDVTLGGARLNLQSGIALNSAAADLVLIDNQGNDDIVGTFADLPEGATITLNGQLYWITYSGGDGNDVELVVPPDDAEVVGRYIFYNQSAFDGNSAAINSSDDNAIAPDKSPLLPGDGQATLANITNYTRGINGIMIDLAGGGNHSAITADDFYFAVGSNNAPETWSAAPAPSAVTIRTDTPTTGTDRVEVTWADGDILDTYLAVHLLSTISTGLDTPDVFFWGNLMGETATTTPTVNFARSVAADGGAILANGTEFDVGITNTLDINKSNSISAAADRGPIVAAGTGLLPRIDIAPAPEIEDLNGPTNLTPGTDASFVTSVPLLPNGDPDPNVTGVNFYLDTNGNNIFDVGDDFIVAADAVANSSSDVIGWSATFDPAGLDPGRHALMAVPTNANGPLASPAPVFSMINVPPNSPGNGAGTTILLPTFVVNTTYAAFDGTDLGTANPAPGVAMSGGSGAISGTGWGGSWAAGATSIVSNNYVFGTASTSLGLTNTGTGSPTFFVNAQSGARLAGSDSNSVTYQVNSNNLPVGTPVTVLVGGFIASWAGSAGIGEASPSGAGIGGGGRVRIQNLGNNTTPVNITEGGVGAPPTIIGLPVQFNYATQGQIIQTRVGQSIIINHGTDLHQTVVRVPDPDSLSDQADAASIEWYVGWANIPNTFPT